MALSNTNGTAGIQVVPYRYIIILGTYFRFSSKLKKHKSSIFCFRDTEKQSYKIKNIQSCSFSTAWFPFLLHNLQMKYMSADESWYSQVALYTVEFSETNLEDF